MSARERSQQTVLDRTFKGLPVEDATEDFFIVPDQGLDIDQATRRDPENCAFALACKRLYGSTAVVFFRTTAYVDLPDENNKRTVKRFYLPNPTKRLIADLDRGKKVSTAGFKLLAPTPSQTLEGMREQQRRHRARKPLIDGQAEEIVGTVGQAAKPRAKSPRRTPRASSLDGVRSGTGLVHFSQGRGGRTWTEEAIIRALHTWVENYGVLPTLRDWSHASALYPTGASVRQRFGTWNTMIIRAGFVPRAPGGRQPLSGETKK